MHVTVHLKQPTQGQRGPRLTAVKQSAPLFGLAPSGVYPATDITTSAVCSYHAISPLPSESEETNGGIFSVALSIGSRLPDVIWHSALRSPDFPLPIFKNKERLPGRLQ